jgi:hypothetical protein
MASRTVQADLAPDTTSSMRNLPLGDTIELERMESPARPPLEFQDLSGSQPQELPPIDGGKGAWFLLFGIYLIETVIWVCFRSRLLNRGLKIYAFRVILYGNDPFATHRCITILINRLPME